MTDDARQSASYQFHVSASIIKCSGLYIFPFKLNNSPQQGCWFIHMNPWKLWANCLLFFMIIINCTSILLFFTIILSLLMHQWLQSQTENKDNVDPCYRKMENYQYVHSNCQNLHSAISTMLDFHNPFVRTRKLLQHDSFCWGGLQMLCLFHPHESPPHTEDH